eukprot:TRINITY_DN4285_c0_g1_i5.p1 TRINITY_DN4285_c0_g1~~TRINITY_DN4285_c0_g1_i5.p1  ORF type:complete len:576 (-),score=132.81 TRINITY_DN4285_c0_g1_i5:373-2100(-)
MKPSTPTPKAKAQAAKPAADTDAKPKTSRMPKEPGTILRILYAVAIILSVVEVAFVAVALGDGQSVVTLKNDADLPVLLDVTPHVKKIVDAAVFTLSLDGVARGTPDASLGLLGLSQSDINDLGLNFIGINGVLGKASQQSKGFWKTKSADEWQTALATAMCKNLNLAFTAVNTITLPVVLTALPLDVSDPPTSMLPTAAELDSAKSTLASVGVGAVTDLPSLESCKLTLRQILYLPYISNAKLQEKHGLRPYGIGPDHDIFGNTWNKWGTDKTLKEIVAETMVEAKNIFVGKPSKLIPKLATNPIDLNGASVNGVPALGSVDGLYKGTYGEKLSDQLAMVITIREAVKLLQTGAQFSPIPLLSCDSLQASGQAAQAFCYIAILAAFIQIIITCIQVIKPGMKSLAVLSAILQSVLFLGFVIVLGLVDSIYKSEWTCDNQFIPMVKPSDHFDLNYGIGLVVIGMVASLSMVVLFSWVSRLLIKKQWCQLSESQEREKAIERITEEKEAETKAAIERLEQENAAAVKKLQEQLKEAQQSSLLAAASAAAAAAPEQPAPAPKAKTKAKAKAKAAAAA